MTHAQIIRSAGKPSDIAELCGVNPMTVHSWVHRNRIPSEYWAVLAREGKATLEQLAAAVDSVA